MRAWLGEAWRRVGAALVGPLILVGASGVVVLLGYNSNPDVANARLAEAPFWLDAARSLHLWSSNALLAGSALHVAWVWRDARVAGPYRHAYLMGAFLLALLALEHVTGHALRWDAAARRIADYQEAWLPGGWSAEGFQLPLHVGVLGGLTLVVSLLHIGLVGGGAHVRVRPAFPRGRHRALIVGSTVAAAAVVLLALLWPAPVARETMPWPMGVLEDVSKIVGAPWAFAAAGFLAWALVVLQTTIARSPRAARSTQALLGLFFAASLFR